jgi:hypothetical protein
VFQRPDNWAELIWQQKRDLHLYQWISGPGIKFASKQTEEDYKAHITRSAKAVRTATPTPEAR